MLRGLMGLLLHVDGAAGISGDMTLGALVDLGVPVDVLRDGLSTIKLGGWQLSAERVVKGGLRATKVHVDIEADHGPGDHHHAHSDGHRHDDHAHDHDHDHGHDHGHDHDHDHDHDHARDHGDGHGHQHGDDHAHGRTWPELRELIGSSGLPPRAKDASLAVFRRLCEVEAELHGVDVDRVRLHEAGAIDAVIDICGSCLGFEILGWPEISASPPDLGGGSIRCAHGVLPVPSPATLRLLEGRPVTSSGLPLELTTPTGAALLSTLASRWGAFPAMAVRASGFGAGTKDLPDRANVVRFTLGESLETGVARPGAGLGARAGSGESHLLIEADLDDADPQLLAAFCERARELGAHDATLMPVTMKKGRAGTRLTLVASEESRERLLSALFSETTTIGCRIVAAERAECERELREIATPYGPVRVKIARWQGRIVNIKPEHDDCLAAARRLGVPLKDVASGAASAARTILESLP